VEFSRESIRLQLVATADVPAELVSKVKDYLLRTTGKSVDLTVRRVASADELRVLREALATRSRPATQDPYADLDALSAQMVMRAEKTLAEVWPAESAPRKNAEIVFETQGPKLVVRYTAARDLEPAAIEAISKAIQSKPGSAKLRIECVREAPAHPKRQK